LKTPVAETVGQVQPPVAANDAVVEYEVHQAAEPRSAADFRILSRGRAGTETRPGWRRARSSKGTLVAAVFGPACRRLLRTCGRPTRR
jgi:hypothetical protein